MRRRQSSTEPAGGYDFENKARYRAQLYKTMSLVLDLSNSMILMLPAKEGLEIQVARDHGVIDSNIWIVDKNPAIVAVHKRNAPDLNTIGVDVARVGEYVPQSSLRFANLDLCRTVLTEKETFHSFIRSGVMKKFSFISVTVLRAREHPKKLTDPDYHNCFYSRQRWPEAIIDHVMRDWNDNNRDHLRLSYFLHQRGHDFKKHISLKPTCLHHEGFFLQLVQCGSYTSSNGQPMLTFLLALDDGNQYQTQTERLPPWFLNPSGFIAYYDKAWKYNGYRLPNLRAHTQF